MKRIVSVSIGSSKRNHTAELDILGERFSIERIGTDGSISKAVALISELDGSVAAFGMGGIDLYIWAGQRRYIFREAKRIAAAAKRTPIVDGSGLKNSLERKVIEYLEERSPASLQGRNVLMTSAMDRFGMADALAEAGANIIYGDLMFALGLPIPIHSLKTLNRVARCAAPIVVQLPFRLVYPTGKRQESSSSGRRYEKYYEWAHVLAGDFHMINKYMPSTLQGKTIITNTVTNDDVELLRSRGASRLVTTTPHIHGRSFGTNVMEALLVALMQRPVEEIRSQDYLDMLDRIEFVPWVAELSKVSS